MPFHSGGLCVFPPLSLREVTAEASEAWGLGSGGGRPVPGPEGRGGGALAFGVPKWAGEFAARERRDGDGRDEPGPTLTHAQPRPYIAPWRRRQLRSVQVWAVREAEGGILLEGPTAGAGRSPSCSLRPFALGGWGAGWKEAGGDGDLGIYNGGGLWGDPGRGDPQSSEAPYGGGCGGIQMLWMRGVSFAAGAPLEKEARERRRDARPPARFLEGELGGEGERAEAPTHPPRGSRPGALGGVSRQGRGAATVCLSPPLLSLCMEEGGFGRQERSFLGGGLERGWGDFTSSRPIASPLDPVSRRGLSKKAFDRPALAVCE